MIAFRKVLAYLYALCFMLMSVLAAFTIVQGTTVFDNLSTVLNVVSLVLTFSTGVTFGLGAWNLFMVALGRPYHVKWIWFACTATLLISLFVPASYAVMGSDYFWQSEVVFLIPQIGAIGGLIAFKKEKLEVCP